MENVKTESDRLKERSDDHDAVIDIGDPQSEVERNEQVNIENVETESEQMERSDDAVIDIKNPYSALATSVRSELKSLNPLSEVCSIHRVQESLRQLDEKAYTPRVVSIGPIHHGKQELRAMEEYKRRYLQSFLERTNVHLEDFIKLINENEEKMRNCYAETIDLDSDNFVKMILMDAAFIFEVLFRRAEDEDLSYDRVYHTPIKIFDITADLYMVENQLPFFILEDLFRLANINISSDNEENLSILKITHYYTHFYWGYLGIENFDECKYSEPINHLVHFLKISVVPFEPQLTKKPKILTTPSVTKLHQAGVKFQLGSGKNLFDIRFHDGILEIPQIAIRGWMENVMKNLLAFEQSRSGGTLFINDYVILMNYLVNTPKDVELLVQDEIIYNPIGDCEHVSSLFHRLNQRPVFSSRFLFSSLVEDLNKYCKRPWHKWTATLKEDYFKTPWTTISFFAAVVLLILTLVQTVCSILQVI